MILCFQAFACKCKLYRYIEDALIYLNAVCLYDGRAVYKLNPVYP